MSKYLPTSEILSNLLAKHKNKQKISINALVESLEERGVAVLLAIFAAPVALPMPAPVLATILGTPALFLSLQLAIGRKTPWLPEKIKKKEISISLIEALIKPLSKIEILLRQRLRFLTSASFERILGAICAIFCLVMMIPLPLTNTVPGFAVVLVSLGLFQRDGIFVIGGMIVGTIWCGLLGAGAYFAGAEFADWVKSLF